MRDMTIKEFAKLVNCNPQTLRYYDSVDLLKPAGVDKFSGYRHYDEEQALDFVKIRNLQTAGFTITEIKGLLGKDNDQTLNCNVTDSKDGQNHFWLLRKKQ